MSHELLKLIKPGQRPGELCLKCTVPTEDAEHTTPDGRSVVYRKEPCTSVFERFNQTGKGSGLEPGEPLCLASLQAEANMIQNQTT